MYRIIIAPLFDSYKHYYKYPGDYYLSHSDYMYKAICEAKKCQTDVPVGAVIVKDNKILSIIQEEKKELKSYY